MNGGARAGTGVRRLALLVDGTMVDAAGHSEIARRRGHVEVVRPAAGEPGR